MKNFKLFLMAVLAFAFVACNDDDPVTPTDSGPEPTRIVETTVQDEDGNDIEIQIEYQDFGAGIGTRTLEATKSGLPVTHVLDGFVFVNDGQTLTIEAGAVIKGQSGQGSNASALIVARGGTIDAQGTAANPIIMTGASDNLDGSLGTVSGQWGGLIILGNAPITNTGASELAVEGIPTSEARGLYGGADETDNSGTLQYVSIRHGGTSIGAGNEINGLTLGGVGSGTTIDHIEVIYNADDGVEFFGGRVNTKYMAVAYVGDDGFDWDIGYTGKGQFWSVFTNAGNRGGELDGADGDESATPFATPTVYNATFYGAGNTAAEPQGNYFRDNSGGFIWNSVYYNWNEGVRFEYRSSIPTNSAQRVIAGDLKVKNSVFADIERATSSGDDEDAFRVVGDALPGTSDTLDIIDSFQQWGNAYSTSLPGGNINIALPNTNITFVPSANAAYDVTAFSDSFFSSVAYAGAFEPGTTEAASWLAGWTALDAFHF